MPHFRVTIRHLASREVQEVRLDASTWVEAFRRALDSRMCPDFWEVLEVAGSDAPDIPPTRRSS